MTVMTDITDQKKAERELLDAKQQTEEANRLVMEKNQMLENLSAKLAKYLSRRCIARFSADAKMFKSPPSVRS